ncbi:MAG: hypothetical protein H6662_20025 [Ardenticatenaceae bacterium]|nr:hypothetical protein [Ardenticatenaceae bacterium]
MHNQRRSYQVYWLLALLVLLMMATACNGRLRSRRDTPLPTQIPEAELPANTNSPQLPATFTPEAQPAPIEIDAATAVVQTPAPAAAETAVIPTTEPSPALSSDTEQLFTDLDNLLNQLDQLNSDDLSDLP